MDAPQKYLVNKFPEFSEENGTEQIAILLTNLKTDFQKKLTYYCSLKPETLTQAQDSKGIKRAQQLLYIGSGGAAVAFWKTGLYFKSIGELEQAEESFKKAALNLEENLPLQKKADRANPTFFLSSAGLLAMQFLVLKELKRDEEAEISLKELLKQVQVSSTLTNVNEILFGRAGYLYCLLLLKRYHPQQKVEKEVEIVMKELYDIGSEKGERDDLRFTFYEQVVLGAGHGHAGIFYLMLEALKLESEELKFQDKLKQTLKKACEKILSLQYEDGNLKQAEQSTELYKVFWCHGAPGFIAMLCAAYERYGDEKYIAAAELAGECTWKKGILKKGNCLCHGIGGNAYCLMTLYRKTKNPKWKYRALSFGSILANDEYQAIFAEVEDPLRISKGKGNFPFSLMEGVAQDVIITIRGEICMYADFLNKEEKQVLFPGYEIS